MNNNILNYLNESYYDIRNYITPLNCILGVMIIICFCYIYRENRLCCKRSKILISISLILMISIVVNCLLLNKKRFIFIDKNSYIMDDLQYKEVLKKKFGDNQRIGSSNEKVKITMRNEKNNYKTIECVLIPELITDTSVKDKEKTLVIEKYQKDDNLDVFVLDKIE